MILASHGMFFVFVNFSGLFKFPKYSRFLFLSNKTQQNSTVSKTEGPRELKKMKFRNPQSEIRN